MAKREREGREDGDDRRRSRLESVIPDLIKKAVQGGYDRATGAAETLNSFIGESKLPKEIVNAIFSQIDETKNGLFRVVAKEMRDFLEHTNIAGEMQKLLTTVQFEVNTTIRFRPNEPSSANGEGDGGDAEEGGKPGLSKPEVKTEVTMSRSQRRERRRRERPGRAAAGGSSNSGGEDGGGGTTSGGDE